MHGRSGLDAVAMAYAREVYVRNEAKLQGLSHSLVTTFHQASSRFLDKVEGSLSLILCESLRAVHVVCLLQSIHQCWCLLKMLVDVPSLPPTAHALRGSPSLQLAFLAQARHYLENRSLSPEH